MLIQRYRHPKRGSTDSEYEDAIACSAGPHFPRRLAVADGASESSFARLWAGLLVDAYATGDLAPSGMLDRLGPLQRRWLAEVADRPLPWYAAEKARSGAFAALVGLTLHDGGAWQAMAIGDCCVIQARDDRVICSFPLESAAAFDNRPRLLSSNPERNQELAADIRLICGRWLPDDRFLLMSDALAAYVIDRAKDGAGTVDQILPFRGRREFRRWIEERRDDRSLRNDDVSLLRVRVS